MLAHEEDSHRACAVDQNTTVFDHNLRSSSGGSNSDHHVVAGADLDITLEKASNRHRVGYFIHLPNYTMEVGAACSGLRQLSAILALSLAIGHFSNRQRSYKVALALLSLPIAVVLSSQTGIDFIRDWLSDLDPAAAARSVSCLHSKHSRRHGR